VIVSGRKLAYLEPQEKIWRGESGRSYPIQEIRERNKLDSLMPFEGIADFSIRAGGYPGTLFRFPLRFTPELVEKSKLVDKESSKSSAYNNPRKPISLWKMQENIKEWVTEMKQALFFLNHVTEIRFFVIEEHSNNMTPTKWMMSS